jgi:hypothetical protein
MAQLMAILQSKKYWLSEMKRVRSKAKVIACGGLHSFGFADSYF